jgi:nicotinamidase-related amidase
MPATTLDRRTALIIVDLQKGIASIPSVHPMADVVKNASSLAAARPAAMVFRSYS